MWPQVVMAETTCQPLARRSRPGGSTPALGSSRLLSLVSQSACSCGVGALVGTATYDIYGRVATTAPPNGATTTRD